MSEGKKGKDFKFQISQFVAKANGNANSVTRKVVLDVASRVIDRSPIGNRELWAINDVVLMNRENYRNWYAGNDDPLIAALNASGGGARVSERTLKKLFRLRGPSGYVGGRFRANWQLGEGAKPSGKLYEVGQGSYPGAAETLSNIDAKITNNPAGKVFYLVNNLPYAVRLEEGWSSQAPSGMVGLTVIEFSGIVDTAAKEVNP